MRTVRSSSLSRIELCPGSRAASKDIENKAGEPAISGTRVHSVLEKAITIETLQDRTKLNHAVQMEATAHHCDKGEDDGRERFIAWWFSREVLETAMDHQGAKELFHELKMDLIYPPEDDLDVSSHPDLIMICNDDTIHVFEFKTGYGKQETADGHIQLQSYIVSYWDRQRGIGEQITAIRGHLLCAGETQDEFHSDALYEEEHIDHMREYIRRVCLASFEENAPRTPNPHLPGCRYCPARGTERCPETIEVMETALATAPQIKEIDLVYRSLEPEKVAAYLEAWAIARPIVKRLEDCAKIDIEEKLNQGSESPVPGWTVNPGKIRKDVHDPSGLIGAIMSQCNLTLTQLSPCLKPSITKVKKAIWAIAKPNSKAAGIKKKDLDAAVDDIWMQFSTPKQDRGSLAAVRKK